MQVLHQGTIRFVEAKFYFRAVVGGIEETLVMCSLYSPADEYRRDYTHGALIVCNYEGDSNLVVIRVKSILSVIGMMPFKEQDEGTRQFYLVEKFGLGVVDTGDIVD